MILQKSTWQHEHLINLRAGGLACIQKFFRDVNCKLEEVYFVGSNSSQQKNHNDLDTVIILDEEIPLNKLAQLSEKLYFFLIKELSYLLHFKLFTITELEKMRFYDGFRLKEFQMHNTSVFNSPLLCSLPPKIDSGNLSNSLMIQFVYSIITLKYNTINEVLLNAKFRNRVRRNFTLFREFNNQKESLSISESIVFCLDLNPVFKSLFESILKGNFSYFVKKLPDYYNLIRHEFVNKKFIYNRLLKLR